MTDKTLEHVCGFCGKKFTSETYLVNHLCERKRRYLQREDKPVKLAFMAYQQFYRRSMAQHKLPTMESFEASKLYTAFVRFARHLLDLAAINPMSFVDFLVRTEAPIDKWTHPVYYGTYIRELNKNEGLLAAIDRSFMVMEHWAIETGERWQDFFRMLAPAKAVLWIINGRISPWLLFTASSTPDLLARLNPEQLRKIEDAIDVAFWMIKLERHQADVEQVRAMLKEWNI